LTFGDTGKDVEPAEAISVDCMLPRVMYLAEHARDRQTKVASCELLHALVTASVGFHAANAAGRGTEKRYSKLFDSLFPCVFRLAVDGDPVSNQLFPDLTLQLIRWFVTKKEYKSIARGLLDAILGGLESVDNGKLREVYALIALLVPECILLTVFVLVVAAGLLEVPC
jgi:DNA-dependent protein kinase catalytic subunit